MSSDSLQLSSTTAPGKNFASRAELAAHYKSDWHRYNLKRREAGLPVLLEMDFEARLAAAKAVRNENAKKGGSGTDHLKNGKKNKKKQQQKTGLISQVPAYDRMKEEQQQQQQQQTEESVERMTDAQITVETQTFEPTPDQIEEEDMVKLEIDPRQCLFDRHTSATVEGNVLRMQRKYGFFVPDREYLVDLEGLIGYCHEKIKLGHLCLYCQRMFGSWQACQNHMISSYHTKLRYEAGIDLEEFDLFYDFSEADNEFLDSNRKKQNHDVAEDKAADEEAVVAADGENDDEWEDITDDEAGNEDDQDMDDDDEDFEGYEEEVARMGFDVTPLGELVFPDGRIIGHRGLQRYYKQRLPQHSEQSTAVQAARKAAGERLYRGRVYNIGNNGDPTTPSDNETKSLALTKAGIAPGLAAGRAGKGILVQDAAGTFSQVSIYRYRAAIRKQRCGEFKGSKIHEKTNQNINRMDKKHNRLMNGVSVAHAAR